MKLTIDQVKAYLYTEGLATQAKLDKVTFRGYGSYYGDEYVKAIPTLEEILAEEDIDLEIVDKDTEIDGK